LLSLKDNGRDVESRLVNQHQFKALFFIFGHSPHDDSMHRCLPGIAEMLGMACS